MAAGKSASPSGTLLDFLLWDRHSLLEFSWDNSKLEPKKGLKLLVTQTLHHLCRDTLVALHCVAFFALCFAVSHEIRATPLKVPRKKALSHPRSYSIASRATQNPEGPAIETIKSRLIAWTFQSIRLKISFSDWKFQSRLKVSISLENFNPDLDNSPQQEPYFQSRFKVSIWDWSLESFNPGAKSWIFSIFGPSGKAQRSKNSTFRARLRYGTLRFSPLQMKRCWNNWLLLWHGFHNATHLPRHPVGPHLP